jgi:hypothetical protein
MAQRTAFLNSDAKWYNKDFHHTWIHNYLLHQVWVMFTDYNTKNEFKLGNGQISGGKAIIRCTRTTGNFAGSKMLALFESTATESISTSGDKKVFIEIPEIYVNDSTAITDTLTQGLNLWVGVIKSEADYPSHTNYIPLWEITGGDWEQAVDVRPEILARGKPNTISYTDNNGVQRNMMLDASSLNKFLKSNWAWVAPSWADVWDVVEVSNLKNTFFAWEDLLPKSMFRMESELDTIDAVDESIRFGYDTNSAKVQLNTILSGEEWDYVKLNLEGFNTPADNVNVRIETVDSSGNATGTLINPDATATISPSWTLEEMSINLAWMIDWTTAGQEVAVVLSRSGALSTSNYYKVWVATADTGIWKVKTFDWTSWNLETGKKWYISSPLFMEEWAMQSKATTEFLAETTGYVEAGATAGNEFTGVRFGMIEYDGFKPWDKVFLTDTGELSNISWAIQKQIGSWVKTDVVEISSIWIWWGWWVMTYDAVVAADGSWDYTNVRTALLNDKRRIFIRNWTYNHENEYWDAARKWTDILIEWESKEWVIINFTSTSSTSSSNRWFIHTRTWSWTSAHWFKLCNVTINVTPWWGDAWDNWPYNALFKDTSTINYNNPWIVDNCDIYLDSTNWAAVLCDNVRMWSNVAMWRIRTRTDRARVWFFWCNIETKWHNYRIWLSWQPYWTLWDTTCFYDCYIKSSWSMWFWVRSCRFNNCKVSVGNVDWQSLRLYCTSFYCDNIFNWYSYDWWQVSIPEIIESRLSVSTDTSPSWWFKIWWMSLSNVFLSATTNTLAVEQDVNGWWWYNSYFRCDDNNSTLEINKCIIWCEIECDAITIDASGENMSWCVLWSSRNWNNTLLEWIVTWCTIVWLWTMIWDDYYSYNGTWMVWCKCIWSGQRIILNWEWLVFTWNHSYNLKIELWENASKCVVNWNYANSYNTIAWSSYCCTVWNCFSLSTNSQWTGHVYANNID